MILRSIHSYRYHPIAHASLLVLSLTWITSIALAFVCPTLITPRYHRPQIITTSTITTSTTTTPLPRSTRRNVSAPSQLGTGTDTAFPDLAPNGDNPRGAAMDDTPSVHSCSKLRRLKDRMWVREALEDITAAEFACTLATAGNDHDDGDGRAGGDAGGVGGVGVAGGVKSLRKKTKRAVDFENLLGELDRRVEEMCVRTTYDEASADAWVCYPFDHTDSSQINPDPEQECWTLKENVGMGSVTYNLDQRDALIARILEARQNLIKAMAGNVPSDTNSDLDDIREQLNPDDTTTPTSTNKINQQRQQQQQQQQQIAGEPILYVRDDGSVDWDGALQDRAALKKIGTAVWSRINGEDPSTIDTNDDTDDDSNTPPPASDSHSKQPVTAQIMETDAIRALNSRLDTLRAQYDTLSTEHTNLLSSAVDAGSAVASVNLATLDPSLRARIRNSSETLERKRVQLTFQTLNYELERIYTYLDTDLGNVLAKGYIPLSDRLNVAEFGLLESQIESLNGLNEMGEAVDADVLAVVLDQTNDFKRRLAIDYSVAGFTFDSEGINTWWNDVVDKGKKGLVFYGKGMQLLSDDLVFSSSLIGRALTVGYILKPREVRTLRRTVKDVVTCVPVVIILVIPLTPVGHVLVFGAIQRFFPDFFPSCFTERRQNLLSLYETAEFKGITIDENWREKIYRAMSAIGYTVADTFIRKEDTVQKETTDS